MYIHPLRSPSKTTRIGLPPHLAEVGGGRWKYENFKEVRVGHSFGLAVGMRCSCPGWHQGIKGGVWDPNGGRVQRRND